MRRELGVAQGFDHYDDDLRSPGALFNGRRAELIANRAIGIVRRFGEGPFFLFVNFFDPHAPYRPPPPYDRGLPEFDEGPFVMAGVERLRAIAAGMEPSSPEPWERDTAEAMIEGYDAELSYLDIHLGRLLAELESRAPVLVAITSDHGESFGEHGYTSHGAHLYEDNVRVPLIVRYPDQAGAGTRISTPVQNHRLFATLLDAAGLSLPAGVTLRAINAPGGTIVTEVRRSDNNVSLFGEIFDRDLRSVYAPPYKLISSSDGTIELFDLASDEAEAKNLASLKREPVERLSARLEEIDRAHPALFDEAVRADLSPETTEALRALGYLD
jgi:arylsulfatase A-like enzyme